VSSLKKLLPILGILVIAGVGLYFLKGSKGGPGLPGVTKNYTAKGIKAVIDLGIPMKCSYKVGEMEYEGYVKGQQWRGHIQLPNGNQGEIIFKDNCMWSWDDKKQGTKMCFEPTEEGETLWDNPQQGTDMDLDYQCRPAAITDAKFTPPTDVNFMDLDDMMGPMGQDTYDMPDIPDMPDAPNTIGVPTTPEDFDMSRYKE